MSGKAEAPSILIFKISLFFFLTKKKILFSLILTFRHLTSVIKSLYSSFHNKTDITPTLYCC